ncbi:hypothetical protein ACOMHN_006217 [Nucella lapillus]
MSFLSNFKKLFRFGYEQKKDQWNKNIKKDIDPMEIWDIIGELGEGAFGAVYKAQNKQTQALAALKRVEIRDDTDLEDFSVEINILAECVHSNIVGLHEAFFFDGKLWMFIEFCGGGALDSIMVELEKPLTEAQICYVCHEICVALDYLHRHNVIHRDIKAGNVLLNMEGDVKLADFGVSARNTQTHQRRDTFIGTPYWMAPEVILCETLKDTPYDFKADIWSLGVTMIEFAEIEPPNKEMHPMRVLIKIHKSDPPTLDRPRKWSKEFVDFVTKCLKKDPKQRPSAAELLEHPFLRSKGAMDKTAICDLINESKAEVVEVVEDLTEEEDIKEMKRHMNEDSASVDMDNVSGYSTDHDSKPREKSVEKDLSKLAAAEEARTGPEPTKKEETASDKRGSPKKGPAPQAPTPPQTQTPPPKPAMPDHTPPVKPQEAARPEKKKEEDKLSDEGLGASGDEISDGSQNESPSKADKKEEEEAFMTALAQELLEDIEEDVMTSATINPSIPAVVFEVITEYVQSGSVGEQAEDEKEEIKYSPSMSSSTISEKSVVDVTGVEPGKGEDNLEMQEVTVQVREERQDPSPVITIGGKVVPETGVVVINGHATTVPETVRGREPVRPQPVVAPPTASSGFVPSSHQHTTLPHTDLDTFHTTGNYVTTPEVKVSNLDDDLTLDRRSDTASVNTMDSLDKELDSEANHSVVAPARPRGHLRPRNENKSHYRTMTKTRTYLKDGKVVTSTTTKVVATGQENKVKEEHDIRKQDLRELKLLQKQEHKQYQDLLYKNHVATEGQERKCEGEMQALMKYYEQDMETLTKQQKQAVEKAELSQQQDMKLTGKRIKQDQEKETKKFRDKLKQEMKLLKQELDLRPKGDKDTMRRARETKDIELQDKERMFLESQSERLEKHMRQLAEQHRQRIAMLESQFLQQKQQLLRAREAAVWEREKEQLHEKHQLAKGQLKDMFFLKRHQMLTRHQKELDQMKRYNATKEEELQAKSSLQKRRLPRVLKAEAKTRAQMFKQSLRLSTIGTPDDDKMKIKQFEENEKRRMKAELLRQEDKQKKQWEELMFRNGTSLRELEQLQAEKRKLLMEQETAKIKELDEQYATELREWKAMLIPRKQKLEEEFFRQKEEQEKFYGSSLRHGDHGPPASYMHPNSSPSSLRSKQSASSLASRHSTLI